MKNKIDINPKRDIQVFGPATRYRVARATADDARSWMKWSHFCPLLQQHHISHVGIMDAAAPFEIVRTNLGGTFMIACVEGEGVVLVNGGWKKIRANQACLQPPFMMNAMKCLPGKSWKFAWVRYDESREVHPIISSESPVIGAFASGSLQAAIDGLYLEAGGDAAPALLHHWSELIHQYVVRFAQPHRQDPRLWEVWRKVEAQLSRNWTLAEIAKLARMSGEHLRRVCQKELGRSPMQHLTFLRLHKAQHLLSVTDDKVEYIAREVGFESVSTFSNTYKKWVGWRPSEQRGCE
ncbi:MAG: helix-turn-helix transcriptional regulator [Akkermansiaceae bacterium]